MCSEHLFIIANHLHGRGVGCGVERVERLDRWGGESGSERDQRKRGRETEGPGRPEREREKERKGDRPVCETRQRLER